MRLPSDIHDQLVEIYRLNRATGDDPIRARHEAVAEIAAGYGVSPDRLRARLQQQAKPLSPVKQMDNRTTRCCARCGGKLQLINTTWICARCECGLDDIWRVR